jgi:diaminopimelate epimerase
VRARTYEKGVEAETLACGTGALASALAARLSGRISADHVEVEMPGGVLRVGFVLPEETPTAEGVRELTLEGPAEVVYQGTLEF